MEGITSLCSPEKLYNETHTSTMNQSFARVPLSVFLRTRTLTIFLLAALASGCAATLVQTADPQYVASGFDLEEFDKHGVGMLPVGGVERVSRTVIARAADSLMYFAFPNLPFVDSRIIVQEISTNGLADAYTSFSKSVDETGFIDPSVLQQLSEATGVRYFIRIATDRLEEGKNYRIEKNNWTGRNQINSYDKKSIRVFGQVWDAATGETVWEGTGSARASESRYSYIEQDEADFYAAATITLLQGITGLEELGTDDYPASQAWAVSTSEELPEYERDYRGFAYSITPCRSGKSSCFYAEIFEPFTFERETPFQGLRFGEEMRLYDTRQVEKSIHARIDRYLRKKGLDLEANAEVGIAEGPAPEEIEEVPCDRSDVESYETMVVLIHNTEMYDDDSSSAATLALVKGGTPVKIIQQKKRYSRVCYGEGEAWINNDNLARAKLSGQ